MMEDLLKKLLEVGDQVVRPPKKVKYDLTCKSCGKTEEFWSDHNPNFCPNCGSKDIDWYTISESRVNESDGHYSKKVATDIVVDGAEVTNISEVTIQYDFELEQKSWGFNGVIFAALGSVEIEAEVDGKLTTFQVDLTNADVSWVPGKAFYPSQMTVHASKDGKVSKVEIDVDYWTP